MSLNARMETSRYRRALVQGLEPKKLVSRIVLCHMQCSRGYLCVLVRSCSPTRRLRGAMCHQRQRLACPCAAPSHRPTSPLLRRHREPQVFIFPTFCLPPRFNTIAAVGSAAWISAKSSDTSSVVTLSSRKKDNRSIAPSNSVSMISSASSGTTRGAQSPRAPASVTSTVSTAWWIAEFRARQDRRTCRSTSIG
jgi:hypothetical protein